MLRDRVQSSFRKNFSGGEGIGTGYLNFANFFHNKIGFLLIVSIVNVYTFGLEQILKIVYLNWLTIDDFLGGGEISPPLGV